MEQNRNGSTKNQLRCDVCKINFMTNADYALHEFSKKHCDNLIKLAKNKTIVTKQKTKNEVPKVEKEVPKHNIVTHTGSIAKYGYFVPGKVYSTAETHKEYSTDYNPYLQKFAENPFKEKFTPPNPPSASFCKNKKKKIKTCQICNIVLTTVPEYEAHMKSPQHIWKLKVTGMGVSAHFVKASTDLHTTDIFEMVKSNSKIEEELPTEPISLKENPESSFFPLLYCYDCELLLNSPHQYNAHIAGKSHLECAKKKADIKEKKEKSVTPVPNQLFCYTCKISLNNLFQYNEHKNGKKHKTKCKNLIKNGITIPLEERVPGLSMPYNSNKIVYPELYEKFVLEKQKQIATNPTVNTVNNSCKILQKPDTLRICDNISHNVSKSKSDTVEELSNYKNIAQNQTFSKFVGNLNEVNNIQSKAFETVNTQQNVDCTLGKNKEIFFPLNSSNVDSNTEEFATEISKSDEEKQIHCSSKSFLEVCHSSHVTPSDGSHSITNVNSEKQESYTDNQFTIISITDNLRCSICCLNFNLQSHYDVHLNTEDHLQKILEFKNLGKLDHEIINTIFSDRSFVKPDSNGKLTCSVCNVTADNEIEFNHHFKSVVHKYTIKEYRRKRTAEVKEMVRANEIGLYFCKLCKEGWISLLEFSHHLNLVKHRSILSAERTKKILTKRRTVLLQKQRLRKNLKNKVSSTRRLKQEKNPGVRTKISGVATDLCTGAQASIPNLEPLEPKIDTTKNVNLGIRSDVKTVKIKKRRRKFNANFKFKSVFNQKDTHPKQVPPLIPSYNKVPPLIPSCNKVPPLMPSPEFQLPHRQVRPSGPNPFVQNRQWTPYSTSYQPRPAPFFGRPDFMVTPYCESPYSLQRTRFPKLPSLFHWVTNHFL